MLEDMLPQADLIAPSRASSPGTGWLHELPEPLDRSLGRGIPVCLEVRSDNRTMAHLLNLPGCFSRGNTEDDALSSLGAAIEEYWIWLKRHRIPLLPQDIEVEDEASPRRAERAPHPRASDFKQPGAAYRIAERQLGVAPFESGDAAALFQMDLLPPDNLELERYLDLARAAQRDLLELLAGFSKDQLQRPLAPGKRTIEQAAWHIANAEEWYISRLGVIPELASFDDNPAPLPEYLQAVRSLAERRFRSMSPLERATVFRIPQFTEHPDEPWTLRKALRRMIEHEREHTANIRQFLKSV